MSNILASAKSYIADTEHLKQAFLISLELPGQEGAYVYFTTYFRNIVYKGKEYVTDIVKSVGDVKQTKQLTVYKLPIKISGAIENEVDRVLNSKSFIDRKIIVHRVFLDDDGEIIPIYNDNSSIVYFEGVIVTSNLNDNTPVSGKGTSTITWNCSSKLYDFESVNGRITDDASHRGLVSIDGVLKPTAAAKRPEYQLDRGFTHANKSVKILAEYQTREKRTRIKTRKAGGFRGVMGRKHISMEEYWADVVREVDMDINLSAKYIPVLYGVQKTAGIPIFVDTHNDNPDEVWAVYAFCEGEVDGFLDIYFGDNPMICVSDDDLEKRVCLGMKREIGDTIGSFDHVNNKPIPSVDREKYVYNDGNGDIEFWLYNGGKTQEAAPELVSLAAQNKFKLQVDNGIGPEYWDDTFKLLDTAYMVVKFNLNDNRTELPEIAAEIQGKKVDIFHDNGTVTSDKTSLNLVWQTLDYLRSPIYGAGLDLSSLDLLAAKKCADIADIIDTSYDMDWVPYWRYLGWEDRDKDRRQIIQGSAYLNTSDTVFKNVQALLAQYDASLNIVSGKYTLTMEAEAPSLADITDGDILPGTFSVSDTSMENKFNSVQASILDPAKTWGSNSITFYNDKFKKEDNNKDRKASITFPFITNYYTARTRVEYYLNKSRFSRKVSFELPFKFIWLYPNANITISRKRYKWDKKKFLVEDVTWTARGTVRLTAKEYDDGVFLNSPQTDNSSNQIPPVIVNVLPPRNLEYSPDAGDPEVGLNGVLSWLPSLTKNVAYYTIRYTGSVDLITLPVTGTEKPNQRLSIPLYRLSKGQYTFEVRAVSRGGETSMGVKLVADVDPSKILSKVPNFRVINTAVESNNVFVGRDVQLVWDTVPDTDEVPNLRYQLQVLPQDRSYVLRDLSISGKIFNFTYTSVMNKEDYKTHLAALGIYRKLVFRIRATGDGGISSIDWTYI